MKRSTRFGVPAAAAVLLGITACTGGPPGGGGGGGGGDENSIRYLVEQPEDPAVLERLEAHIEEDFEGPSGISVDVEAMPQENMRTVLQTQLQSGEGPDVFSWGSGPGYAGALAEAGLLYDLTDSYEEFDWPVYDFAKERVTFDEKIVGVPGEMETIGLFYNKEIFDNLDLDQPETIADLEQAAQTILDTGIVPIGVSDQEGWQGGHLLSMALSSRIGSDGVDALLAGEASWNSPDVVESLRLWEEWNAAGYLPPFPTSLSYDNANAQFYAGEIAILPTGSWLVSGIDENADFEVGYIPFPAEDGPGIFTGGLGSGPYISANTEKVDAALEFVDFLVSEEHGRWTVENIGAIPPYPVDTEGVDASPLFAQVLEDTSKFAGGTGDFGVNIDVLATDTFNEAMWNGVQAILSGQATAEEVAADLDAAAKS